MNIGPATSNGAPIMLLYGEEGRGKTTLATKFPKPLALLLERGLPRGVTIDAVEGIEAYGAIIDAIVELLKDARGYQTLIVDTIDALEPLLLEHVCTKHGWKNIEAPSYGKGWVIADNEWQRFLRGLNALRTKHGMAIVLVGHAVIERIDDPRAPTFTKYLPKLHRRARHLVLDQCDLVGFLAEDLRTATDDSGFRERTRAISSNERFLWCEGTPAFVAKNRFAMPPKVAIPMNFEFGSLGKYWENSRD